MFQIFHSDRNMMDTISFVHDDPLVMFLWVIIFNEADQKRASHPWLRKETGPLRKSDRHCPIRHISLIH